MNATFLRAAAIAASMLLAAGAKAASEADASASAPPPTLSDVLKQGPTSPENTAIPSVRYNAIRETALTYGAQAGLARRSFENLQKLDRQAQNLDVIYNFQALMVEGNVVPPVLSETSDVYDQSSEDMLRVIGKVYRIEQQAHFAYNTPTWRSYLMMGYDFDRSAVAAVAPQNDQEREVWNAGVQEGYGMGVQQADDILKENFARLQRDFLGMVKYHQMLEAGMVTKPFVASTNHGVVRAKDGSMHVGEVFLRITASPDFVSEPGQWKSLPRGLTADRLKRAADPEQASDMLAEARASGLVRERGH